MKKSSLLMNDFRINSLKISSFIRPPSCPAVSEFRPVVNEEKNKMKIIPNEKLN